MRDQWTVISCCWSWKISYTGWNISRSSWCLPQSTRRHLSSTLMEHHWSASLAVYSQWKICKGCLYLCMHEWYLIRKQLSWRHYTQDQLQPPWWKTASWGSVQATTGRSPVTRAFWRAHTVHPQGCESKQYWLWSTTSISVILVQEADYLKLIASLANYITNEKPKGGILVFLPGVQEIKQCMQAIRAIVKKQVDILPLHANLSSDEQRKVFHTNPSKWKIICSTNIAEVCSNYSYFLIVAHLHDRHQ